VVVDAESKRVLIGIYFYPRGGSAHSCRSIARELGGNGLEVTLLAGSRSDLGGEAEASSFYAGLDLHAVEFEPAGTAPLHGSYEDRPGAPDRVLASFDDETFERHVETWSEAMAEAAAPGVDVLYLHHLTPLNEAAARVLPGVPVVGHVHGTELLMLERIAAGAPASWTHAEEWRERICEWAAACGRIVVNDRSGLERAAALLDLDQDRFACIPNGFDPIFFPAPIDRRAHWRRHLVEEPRGWRPGEPPGTVSYKERDLAALDGVVLLAVGRFTEVKRLSLLIEAFDRAQDGFDGPVALILIGGHPGEWEGEHPIETIERTGARNVFLAGWHRHDELPPSLRAGDLLVHASVWEAFGQVLVEAMACGLPVIAVERGGPATIVDDPRTGWLVEPDDVEAMAGAITAAVDDDAGRRRRGERARTEAVERYSWSRLGEELVEVIGAVDTATTPERRA
jgi:glycosyltransferase involved in cell wall biosynthesis